MYCLESSDTCGTPVDRYLWHTCRRGCCFAGGSPDLTVEMPVLAYKKASIEPMMCALVCGACIGLYFILYRSVFDFIGLVLVNISASARSRRASCCLSSRKAKVHRH